MTVYYKVPSKGSVGQSDRSRLRNKVAGLTYYIWRADITALAQAAMGSVVDKYHADLLHYLGRDRQVEEVAEKLVRNVLSETPEEIAAELSALMEDADAGDGVVEHLIVSLRAGEKVENLNEAVEIMLDGLGLQNCPAVAALHLDTDNPHFHIEVVRIDVFTGDVVPLPKYDLFRAHQLLAVMEDKFGWHREDRARWEVRDGRLTGDDGQIDLGPADQPMQWPDAYFAQPDVSQSDQNQPTEPSFNSSEDLIRKLIPELVERHDKMEPFLKELGRHGIELARTGSNGNFRISYQGDEDEIYTENVKPSVVREWSSSKLKARFGPLPESYGKCEVVPRIPTGEEKERHRYFAQKATYQANLNQISRQMRSASARGDAASQALSAARSTCQFPSFSEWKNGALPADPMEIFAGALNLGTFDARDLNQGAATIEILNHENFCGRKFGNKVVYTSIGSAAAKARVTDFGSMVVITGKSTDKEIILALSLFKSRGVDAVSARGFTKSEYRRVEKLAKSLGIELVRADRAAILDPAPTPKADLADHAGAGSAATNRVTKKSDVLKHQSSVSATSPAAPRPVAPAKPGNKAASMPREILEWRWASSQFKRLQLANGPQQRLIAQAVERDRAALRLQDAIRRGLVPNGSLVASELDEINQQATLQANKLAFQNGMGAGIGR